MEVVNEWRGDDFGQSSGLVAGCLATVRGQEIVPQTPKINLINVAIGGV